MTIDIRRSSDRFVTQADGVRTRHSFSYGVHYDPDNVSFGPLLAVNEETVAPGGGYEPHHHADVEIVTWVLDGALDHEDGTGHRGRIVPGVAQRLSAGTGVQHSERNASPTEPLRFVQTMLRSDWVDEPRYEQHVPGPGALAEGVAVLQERARMLVVTLGADESVAVPASELAFLHVTRGAVTLDTTTLDNPTLDNTVLEAGDDARISDHGGYDLRATTAPAEVLVWLMRR